MDELRNVGLLKIMNVEGLFAQTEVIHKEIRKLERSIWQREH